ncbi:MAG TPA: heme-copper oxidase subunit III [Deltaproteobacteria bacterium]|jgi:cytochrome c oxidase subunit 3/cytochrome o ubiquinol oxidase subunit 3|nr:heme-copper oxidase subunit III [Deltaproteobacteria bacterium]
MSAPGAAKEFREEVSASRGKVGMIALIVTESSLLGVFVVAYLFYIGKSLSGPYPKDVLDFPWTGTACLLASSVTVVLAVGALKRGAASMNALWLGVTILLGVAFLSRTAREWRRLIFDDGLSINTNLFGTTFYSLVGLHAGHVLVGLCMLIIILGCALRGALRPAHAERVELVSWYWHFVDVVWLVVLTVVYVVGR